MLLSCAQIHRLKTLPPSYIILEVPFQFEGLNLTYRNIRPSHRRADKNRKTPKCLILRDTSPAIFTRISCLWTRDLWLCFHPQPHSQGPLSSSRSRERPLGTRSPQPDVALSCDVTYFLSWQLIVYLQSTEYLYEDSHKVQSWLNAVF